MNPEVRQAVVNRDMGFLNSLQEGDSRLQIMLESAFVGVETPLHVALRHGHVDFALKILDSNSALAGIPDEGGFYPLHLAAARGYLDVANKLLGIDRSLSCLRDKYGKTALSAAALNEQEDVLKALYPVYKEEVDLRKALVGKGGTVLSSAALNEKVEVLRLLDPACKIEPGLRQALAGEGDDGEELILHLCVVHNKLKSVKALVALDEEVANKKMANEELHAVCSPYKKLVEKKDANGNTALHYAAAKKNVEMQKFLKSKMDGRTTKIMNQQGLTADNIVNINNQNNGRTCTFKWFKMNRFKWFTMNSWDDWYKKDEKWANEMHNTLILLATLIVTVSFQSGVNPPGGFWNEEENKNQSPTAPPSSSHEPGTAIHNNKKDFDVFIYFDMIAFAASLTIILSLVSGFPLKRRSTTWILVISVWIALTSMAMAFLLGTQIVISNNDVLKKIPYVLGAWMGLMVLVLLSHCVILIGLLMKKLQQGGSMLRVMLQCSSLPNRNSTGPPGEHKALKKDEECGKHQRCSICP